MKYFAIFFTLCAVLASIASALPAKDLDPKCRVSSICTARSKPMYGSNDDGLTCVRYPSICLFTDEWCNYQAWGYPELKEISKENCVNIINDLMTQ